MPHISVIVPVYNVEPYLRRCVDSILAQTLDDFELILVDDGTPDLGGKICDEYSRYDDRIIVIHSCNTGVSAARNVGIEFATGGYITFIDSDDWVAESLLETFYSNLINCNADMCVSKIQKIDENGTKLFRFNGETRMYYGREIINTFGSRNDDTFRAPYSKMIRSDICKAIQFPVGRAIAEDFATVYQWYNLSKSVLEVNTALYFYYIRQDSVFHSDYSPDRLGDIDTLEELLRFLKENDYNELYKKYVCSYCYSLNYNITNLCKISSRDKRIVILKKKLRSALRENRIPIIKDAASYEVAYPKLMHFYWILLVIKGKIRKLVKDNA